MLWLCCAAIERQAAFVPASSLAAPFFTSSGSLLDLDAITVTDLNSSNHTRLLNPLSAAASTAQLPIRLQPNKPRVLRHQQLLWLGKQRCRFVLRQYEQGAQRAKERSGVRVQPVNDDPNATQAYYDGEGERDEQRSVDGGVAVNEQATIAAYDDDDSDEQPPSARHHSGYNDNPDDEAQHTVVADATQTYPAAGGAEDGAMEQDERADEHAATLAYDVEVDDEPTNDRDGTKPGSELVLSLGGGSETSPLIMSLASSHSSTDNDDESNQQPLSAFAHSPSTATDAAASKKASARTRVKQPSIVVTAEEQRCSMEEEERQQRRRAEEEKDRKLQREADEQKAAFEHEVQVKAKQREERRRQEEEDERRQEEERRQQREQQEAERQRQAQQLENERVKREAKEKREAEKREKARREREQKEQDEEAAERRKQEQETRMEEEKKKAAEDRKKAEEAAAAAEAEAKQREEAEEAERVARARVEEEERQRQLVAAEKQRVQQMAASQLAWKSKPTKKAATSQQTNTTSPTAKRKSSIQPASPNDKSERRTDKKHQEAASTAEDSPVKQEMKQEAAEEKQAAGVGEPSGKQEKEEKKETKGRKGKRKNAGEMDSKQQQQQQEEEESESEQKKRPSRRKVAESGRVVPITQPAEEQWDAADFTPVPAAAVEQKANAETEQKANVEVNMEAVQEERGDVEMQKEAIEAEMKAERAENWRLEQQADERKAEGQRQEEQSEGAQRTDQSRTETASSSTSMQQGQAAVSATGVEEGTHPEESVASTNGAYAKPRPSTRKRSRQASKGEQSLTGQDSIEWPSTAAEDGAEEMTVAVEPQPPAPQPATDNLSTRSTATLAAMDVLEDMDVAHALATDSMATTDEEVSPTKATAAPKRGRGRPKKTATAKSVEKDATNSEAADETTTETKRTTGRGKRKRDTSVADESVAAGEQSSPRYSHRTRSARSVDNDTLATRTSSTTSTPSHATRRTISKTTTPPQSTVPTRSSSSSSSGPSSSSPVLLFTAIDHSSYSADIDRLHATITTDPHIATHLITNKVRRTDKFLIAYSITPHLQTVQWLEQSVESGRWVAEETGRLVDEEAEAKWGFALSERRVGSGWMGGWQVWCSDSVVPGRASMKGIVEAAGGRMREAGVEGKKGREVDKEKVLVIGCEEDKAACMEWTRAGYTVYDKVSTNTRQLPPNISDADASGHLCSLGVCLCVCFRFLFLAQEILLTGVLKQRFELDKHILYQPAAAAITGKPSAKGRKR